MKKIYQKFCRFEEQLALLLLAGLTLLVFISALMRTFKHPLNWAQDVALVAFAWLIFIGGDVAVRGCTVRGNRGWQVDVSGYCAARTPLATGAHRNIVLERNHIEGVRGVTLVGCADCTITNNTYALARTGKTNAAPISAVNCTNLVTDASVADRPFSKR